MAVQQHKTDYSFTIVSSSFCYYTNFKNLCDTVFYLFIYLFILFFEINKVSKVHPRTVHEGPEGEYSSTISLTLRRLMSYIYGASILDVSRSHTMTQHSR